MNYARGDMRGGDNRIDRDAARYGDRSREPSPYSRERADSRERSRDRYRDRDRVPGNDRREREYCTFFNKRGGCKRVCRTPPFFFLNFYLFLSLT